MGSIHRFLVRDAHCGGGREKGRERVRVRRRWRGKEEGCWRGGGARGKDNRETRAVRARPVSPRMISFGYGDVYVTLWPILGRGRRRVGGGRGIEQL